MCHVSDNSWGRMRFVCADRTGYTRTLRHSRQFPRGVEIAQIDTCRLRRSSATGWRVCGRLEETVLKLGTRRVRFGILPKLCLTMAAVMLVPLATIWFLDYRASVDHLSRDIEERLRGQADAAVRCVNVWMEGNHVVVA